MTSTSTNPADAVVYLTLQETTGDTITTEQGSGVLIAPDEVLTAAHLVYDAAGKTYTSAEVVAGHDGQTTYGSSTASAIHAMPDADWTQLSNAGGDFALIHLATPITDVPVMSLGSGIMAQLPQDLRLPDHHLCIARVAEVCREGGVGGGAMPRLVRACDRGLERSPSRQR